MKEEKGLNEQLMIDLDMHGVSSDWFLRKLVSLINLNFFNVDITLSVGGGLITGRLIGGKKYFELFAESISNAWPGGDKENNIREAFSSQGSCYDEKDDDEEAQQIPQYIHLSDAKFIHGNVFLNVGLWRGKINAVSGFSLGTLSKN